MMTLWNCSKHLIIEKYNCASFLFMITGTVVQKKKKSVRESIQNGFSFECIFKMKA